MKSYDILNTSSSQRSNASNSVENYKKKNSLSKKQINNIWLKNVSTSTNTLTSNNPAYNQRKQELPSNNLTLCSINNKASSQRSNAINIVEIYNTNTIIKQNDNNIQSRRIHGNDMDNDTTEVKVASIIYIKEGNGKRGGYNHRTEVKDAV